MKNDFFSRHSKSPSCSLHVNRACILSSESPFSTFFSFLGSSLREMMGGVNGHRLAPLLPPPKCLISDLSRFSVNIYRPLLSVQGGLELFFKIDSTTWARWKSSLWSQEGNKKSHSMKIRHEEAVWRSPPPPYLFCSFFFPRRVTSLRDWHRPLFPRLLLEWSTGYFQPRRSPERRPGGLLLLLLFLLLPRLRHFFLVFNLSLFVLPISNGPAKKHGRRPFFNIVAFFFIMALLFFICVALNLNWFSIGCFLATIVWRIHQWRRLKRDTVPPGWKLARARRFHLVLPNLLTIWSSSAAQGRGGWPSIRCADCYGDVLMSGDVLFFSSSSDLMALDKSQPLPSLSRIASRTG